MSDEIQALEKIANFVYTSSAITGDERIEAIKAIAREALASTPKPVKPGPCDHIWIDFNDEPTKHECAKCGAIEDKPVEPGAEDLAYTARTNQLLAENQRLEAAKAETEGLREILNEVTAYFESALDVIVHYFPRDPGRIFAEPPMRDIIKRARAALRAKGENDGQH